MKTRVYISGINLVLSSDEIIELRKEYIGRNKHHRSFKIRGKIFTGLTDKEVEESDMITMSKKESMDYFPEMTIKILEENFSRVDINEMEKNLKKKIYEYNRENIRKIVRWSNSPENCYQTMIIETILENDSPVFLIIPSVFVKKMSVSASVDEGVGEFELLLYQRFNVNEKVIEVYKGDKGTSSPTPKNVTKNNADTQNTEANNPVSEEEVKKESKNIGLITDNKIEDEKELKIPTFTLWKTKNTKYTTYYKKEKKYSFSDDLIVGNKSNLNNSNLAKYFMVDVDNQGRIYYDLKLGEKRLKDKKELVESFKSLIKLCTTGKMEEVGLEMLDLFLRNNSIETEYKNPILTKYVQEHHSTNRFKEQIHDILEEYIITNLQDLKIKSLDERQSKLDMNEEINNKFQDNVNLPSFSDKATLFRLQGNAFFKEGFDSFKGGTITVDSIHSLEIIVHNFSYSNKKISYELEIKMYDHFGLDEEDKKYFIVHNGFVAWYVLQKYQEYSCSPFITDLSFREKIEKEK